MSAAFLLTCLVVVASPGTGVVYTVAAGLGQGGRAGVVAAFGCTLGIVPHLLAALTGAAALLEASPLAFEIVRYLGVAYLLWMGLAMLRERGGLVVEAAGRISVASLIGRAILVNLLNPKLSLFFLAFLPQFVDSDDPAPFARMAGLGLVFMGMTFVVFAGYGALAAAARRRILSNARILAGLRLSFAAAFAVLALRLALADRAG